MAKCKKGFRIKKGKCIKISKSFKKSRKSYNPFKMWGSYVGGLVLFLPLIIIPFFIFLPWELAGLILSCPSQDAGLFFISTCSGGLRYIQFVLAFIIPFIIGFLIGWGIHALIRRIRK